MIAPNSISLVVILALAAALLIFLIIRSKKLVLQIVAGVLSVAMSALLGMAAVNDYYGYYQTWSQIAADFSGSYQSFSSTTTAVRKVDGVASGRIVSFAMPGARSGINRRGLVYLPPQYFQPRYAHTDFPVVELIHGTPGAPSAWLVHLNVAHIMDALIARHLAGPMILVMPTMSVGHDFQECVDAPGALDDTYITTDVRADVMAKFRVSGVPAEWGISGYSSGGYCAANLAMRHPTLWGASGIMDGYFRPQDGPAANALHHDATAENANNPLLLAARLAADAHPLPSFWISAGTGNSADVAGALAFGRALHGVEQVTLYREPGASHNFYAWEAAVPRVLAWMWTQLAPPELRVEYPIAGGVTKQTLGKAADYHPLSAAPAPRLHKLPRHPLPGGATGSGVPRAPRSRAPGSRAPASPAPGSNAPGVRAPATH